MTTTQTEELPPPSNPWPSPAASCPTGRGMDG